MVRHDRARPAGAGRCLLFSDNCACVHVFVVARLAVLRLKWPFVPPPLKPKTARRTPVPAKYTASACHRTPQHSVLAIGLCLRDCECGAALQQISSPFCVVEHLGNLLVLRADELGGPPMGGHAPLGALQPRRGEPRGAPRLA